ncbi:hypothetical protein MKZ38_010458 [Zalerion maritima]|uniref:Uncharacterized protein n=1 Tax=Zalerion maritima TaxID=339359 RepID=A0AAD5RJK0_9PEZI|nr:hypothetical protein MKZ38_010458 [Zalerion maritima]
MEEPISTTSSITSTSNTLTCVPAMVNIHLPEGRMTPDMVSFLQALETNNRHTFLKPHASIPTASLQLAKDTLDAFAPTVSDEQQQFLREIAKKRKRRGDDQDRPDALKIRKVHVEGFQTPQVWQQARRVISSTLDLSQHALQELEDNNEIEAEQDADSEFGSEDATADPTQNGVKMMKFGEDGFEMGSSIEDDDVDPESNSGIDSDMEGKSEEISEDDGSEREFEGSELADGDFSDFSEGEESELDITVQDQGDGDEDDEDEGPVETFVEDPNGLNDGFFSIDEFNRQTQWFEDQDARADPNTDLGDESDDEDVDWHADLLGLSKADKKKRSEKKQKRKNDEPLELDEDENEEHSENDAGPTFGDVDLNAPEGASDDGDGEETAPNDVGAAVMGGIDLTANDLFYKDFFAPLPKKGSKNKDYRPKMAKEPTPELSEAEMDRGIANTRRDLFDDLSERSDYEDALSDVSADDPKARRSAHERWQSKIGSEISKLEAAAVAKRGWALMGEAVATDRPSNSLLETDLDWEFAGRRAPVATEETTADIAEIVKRRIIARDFDEITRRRPGSIDAGTRRGLTAVEDLANQERKGLADMYEEQHQKESNAGAYISKAEEKLKKEEQEVEMMWKEVSAQLDALSSWHYKPRPVEAGMQVVSDIATVAMEDVQPSTAQGVSGGERMLAPQEIYKAGKKTAGAGEVVGKAGLPVAKQEMSREERKRRRRREKERIRKAGGVAYGVNGAAAISTHSGGKKALKKETIDQLRKGGVKVINRRGEVVNVDGKKPNTEVKTTGASFKL